MCRDKFVFGLHDTTIRTELLKTHMRPDGTPKVMSDIIAEAKTMESAKNTNKVITETSRGIENTCHWCGDIIPGPTAQQMVAHAQIAGRMTTLREYASSLALGPTTRDNDLDHFRNTPQRQGTSTNNRSIHAGHKSSYMTTMHTTSGRYRSKRLPFGINSAPEELQMRLMTALEGLDGTAIKLKFKQNDLIIRRAMDEPKQQ